MASIMPQTPQKPLPGAFLNTPAFNRQPSQGGSVRPSIFHNSNVQQTPGIAQTPAAHSQSLIQTRTNASSGVLSTSTNTLSAIESAARTMNAALEKEKRYPPLDNYISQGVSSTYDIPSSAAWAPFQKVKMYDIPDQIFHHYNHAQVSTMMGLFADINHAWISIDNALYLWDYTHPYPELRGFEEQPNSITAVKLVSPRPDVFVPTITRLLVVATTSDIFLLGVSCESTPTGSKSVSLYQTKMQVPVKGLAVQAIVHSAKTGRIFFGGRTDEDVYELFYQQEEKWFQSRCTKINHTRKGYQSVVPSLPFTSRPPQDYIVQLAVDDSRDILYALTAQSSIRVFSLQDNNSLNLCTSRAQPQTMADVGHRVGSSHPLLPKDARIVSISPIPATESGRLNLMATTSTGCRLYFSAFSGGFFSVDSKSPLTSMQIHHVRFPPKDASNDVSTAQSPQAPAITYGSQHLMPVSQSLNRTRISERYPPGHFLCFVQRESQISNDLLFMSTPDSGRILHAGDAVQHKFPEYGCWFNIDGQAEDIGLVTPAFAAAPGPFGFGNELAVQYDQTSPEMAVLTNSGIHTYRRRRLIDVFAAAIRYGGGDEGLEGTIRHFVRTYGRDETIATSLAVLCGQASEVTSDSRVAKITDSDLVANARRVFIEHGGKPTINENQVIDQGASDLDRVQPSPRHEGLALYISRLIRSLWKTALIKEGTNQSGALQISPTVALSKVQGIQRDLSRLDEFLNSNKLFIEGLSGPEALGRVSSKQDEVALQGEHRALTSLLRLISNVIEGIAFILVLFEEHVEDIVLSLPETPRQQIRGMTYDRLFCSPEGRELAKELVKAIVNWNIARGSSVDSVTDALRRRCGSFCSADDCVIFKAQEQLKRASDIDATSESSRTLLNESIRLLERVGSSLSNETMRWAVEQYISMSFYAGAIQLCLTVAKENDKANRALAWFNEGRPGQDGRAKAYETRTYCYDLIHQVLTAVERSSMHAQEMVDGHFTVTAKRKREAYDIVYGSEDELFHINLYDWYLSQGWSDRLLEVRSPFVVSYLLRKSEEDITRANLLWRYYAYYNNFIEAAKVQLRLAKSSFDLTLDERIEYLSRARANASTKTVGLNEIGRSRQSRQELMREVTDLLDLANIQGDLIERLKDDERLKGDRKAQVLRGLNGQVLAMDELYNNYADQAEYYDICLLIYQVAAHRNPTDIRNTWENFIEQVHLETINRGGPQPYEVVAERFRTLAPKLSHDETIFPVSTLLTMLCRYAVENRQQYPSPAQWAVSLIFEVSDNYATIISTLEALFYNDEQPFRGRNHAAVAADLLFAIRVWYEQTSPLGPEETFGGEENALSVAETLRELLDGGGLQNLNSNMREDAIDLRSKTEAAMRATSMNSGSLRSRGSARGSTRSSLRLMH